MSEVIKWLESPEGEEWSRNKHKRVWRPLVMLIRDGDPSALMGHWSWLWIAG